MEKPQNCALVIFGASGDLTNRKLMPSIYNIFKQKMLPDKFFVMGVSRTDWSDEDFRKQMHDSIKNSEKDADETSINEFIKHLFYMSIQVDEADHYQQLKDRLMQLNYTYNTGANKIFYLATPPSVYALISQMLGNVQLNDESEGYRRIVVEKPFGYDLKSAIDLNCKLHEVFKESQIYRIDHYLGKETVQNVLVTRFSNGIFEPIWNRNYVHHVEITSAESIGIENRGSYYDHAGALRDMVQNHLMEVTGIMAMEPPSSFDSNSIRNEILKVFQSLEPLKEDEVEKNVIRGQYSSSTIKGEKLLGYREEKDVDPNSKTETFLAMKFYIDNWRWGGVPFYIRTGKRLPIRVTEAVIHFKPTPHFLFAKEGSLENCNQLIIRIQPNEGIVLKLGMKVPGSGYKVQDVDMDFHYTDLSNVHIPEAYERLLYDCMQGDSTLFARADAVESAWKFVAPIQNAWANNPDIKMYGYPAGTWGPEHADELVPDNMTWRYPCKNLTDETGCVL